MFLKIKLRIISLIFVILLNTVTIYSKVFAEDLSFTSSTSCTSQSCEYPIILTNVVKYNSSMGLVTDTYKTTINEQDMLLIATGLIGELAVEGSVLTGCATEGWAALCNPYIAVAGLIVGAIGVAYFTWPEAGTKTCQVAVDLINEGNSPNELVGDHNLTCYSADGSTYTTENLSVTVAATYTGCSNTASSVRVIGYCDNKLVYMNTLNRDNADICYNLKVYNEAQGDRYITINEGCSVEWVAYPSSGQDPSTATWSTPSTEATPQEIINHIKNHPEIMADVALEITPEAPTGPDISLPEPSKTSKTDTGTDTDGDGEPDTDTDTDPATGDDTEPEEDEDLGTLTTPGYPKIPQFDTTMEIPEKSAIGDLITSWMNNAPFVSVIKNFQINASGSCSITIHEPINNTAAQLDFCQYSTVWAAIGAILVSIAYIYSIVIITIGR